MIRNKLEFATSGLDAIVIDKRDGHIVARNCPLPIARQIAMRTMYADAIIRASQKESLA